MMNDEPKRRSIRSFVMRPGRMTVAQKKGMEDGWSQFGIEYSEQNIDLAQVFGRSAKTTLEIGFGMGDTLVQMAQEAPERDFIGVEVHTPGVGRVLARILETGLTNLRVSKHDAVEVVAQQLPEACLDRVQIFFPDPWHKKKHHKRRLVQEPFMRLLASRLASGGVVHLATDWQNYAEQMLEVMEAMPEFENLSGPGQYLPGRPSYRPETKFERRGEKLGHGVWDLEFRKR